MMLKLMIDKSNNIPFIPIYLCKNAENTNIRIINFFLSKYLEFLTINNEYLTKLQNDSESVKLIKIFKNDRFFGYIGILSNKKYFKNSFHWKWHSILYKNDDLSLDSNESILDNIIHSDTNNGLNYITVREICKNLFKDFSI